MGNVTFLVHAPAAGLAVVAVEGFVVAAGFAVVAVVGFLVVDAASQAFVRIIVFR